jgi:hypothetical protein
LVQPPLDAAVMPFGLSLASACAWVSFAALAVETARTAVVNMENLCLLAGIKHGAMSGICQPSLWWLFLF